MCDIILEKYFLSIKIIHLNCSPSNRQLLGSECQTTEVVVGLPFAVYLVTSRFPPVVDRVKCKEKENKYRFTRR